MSPRPRQRRGARSRKAGTRAPQDSLAAPAPVVILDRPQIGENIGFAVRAMLNCGLGALRLVKPREAWPNAKAVAAAAGAEAVLTEARLFDSVADAVSDLNRLYAATARPRDMVKPVLTPRTAAVRMVAESRAGQRVGLLFGRERTGLANDDVARADAVIEVPLNPDFRSLNLAQAVLVCAYEWRLAAAAPEEGTEEAEPRRGRAAAPPTRRELEELFAHLESELAAAGFLFPTEKRPRMVRNIRNMLTRAGRTAQEVRTLRGIIAALVKGRG